MKLMLLKIPDMASMEGGSLLFPALPSFSRPGNSLPTLTI